MFFEKLYIRGFSSFNEARLYLHSFQIKTEIFRSVVTTAGLITTIRHERREESREYGATRMAVHIQPETLFSPNLKTPFRKIILPNASVLQEELANYDIHWVQSESSNQPLKIRLHQIRRVRYPLQNFEDLA